MRAPRAYARPVPGGNPCPGGAAVTRHVRPSRRPVAWRRLTSLGMPAVPPPTSAPDLEAGLGRRPVRRRRVLPPGVAGGALPHLGARLAAVRARPWPGWPARPAWTPSSTSAPAAASCSPRCTRSTRASTCSASRSPRGPTGLRPRHRLDHGAARGRRGPGRRQRVAGQRPLPRRRGRPRRRAAGRARRPGDRRASRSAGRSTHPAVAAVARRLGGALVAAGRRRAGHPRRGRQHPRRGLGRRGRPGRPAASPSRSTTATPARTGRRSARCAPTAPATRSTCSRTVPATSPRTSPSTRSRTGSQASYVASGTCCTSSASPAARPDLGLATSDPTAYVRALAEATEAAELTAVGGLGDFCWVVTVRD